MRLSTSVDSVSWPRKASARARKALASESIPLWRPASDDVVVWKFSKIEERSRRGRRGAEEVEAAVGRMLWSSGVGVSMGNRVGFEMGV